MMRRWLSALALTALLACPAAAQTGKYVGTWLYGTQADVVKVLRLSVSEGNECWGTKIGTDFEVNLEVSKVNSAQLFATVTGMWEDSTQCAALFALGQADCLLPPVGTPSQDYYAILVISKPGVQGNFAADAQRQPFRFRIERWP